MLWRDIIYCIPLLGDLARRIWVPVDSHEAMHLDSPERGPQFVYALEAARQRTDLEYNRAVGTIAKVGGALVDFIVMTELDCERSFICCQHCA